MDRKIDQLLHLLACLEPQVAPGPKFLITPTDGSKRSSSGFRAKRSSSGFRTQGFRVEGCVCCLEFLDGLHTEDAKAEVLRAQGQKVGLGLGFRV